MKNEYTEAIAQDGAAILCNGCVMSVSEILNLLNSEHPESNWDRAVSMSVPDKCEIDVSYQGECLSEMYVFDAEGAMLEELFSIVTKWQSGEGVEPNIKEQ